MLFSETLRYFEECLDIEYDLKYFTSDGAVQIKNALGEVYNLDTVVYKNDL